MADTSRAYRVLLAALNGLPEGTPVHADTCREAFDAAQLSSAERSGALRAACNAKYLRALHEHLPDGTLMVYHVRTRATSRKGAWSMVWVRTALPVPENVCEAEAS